MPDMTHLKDQAAAAATEMAGLIREQRIIGYQQAIDDLWIAAIAALNDDNLTFWAACKVAAELLNEVRDRRNEA